MTDEKKYKKENNNKNKNTDNSEKFNYIKPHNTTNEKRNKKHRTKRANTQIKRLV